MVDSFKEDEPVAQNSRHPRGRHDANGCSQAQLSERLGLMFARARRIKKPRECEANIPENYISFFMLKKIYFLSQFACHVSLCVRIARFVLMSRELISPSVR